ncbi:MAG: tail fiber domain-containing protein [Chthoniobacterales bacterium]
MADVKISGLPASTVPLDGTEVLPVVQGTTTKQVSITNVTAGRAIAALSITTDTYKAASSAGGTLQANNATACLQWGAGGGSGLIFDGGVSSTAANAALVFSPTGTGTVAISPVGALTINPTAASTINNVSIGVTVPLAGKFTTLESSGINILGTNAVKIFASGGVSIGNTTDPGATNLSVTGKAIIQGVTVGKGANAVANNTAVGDSALQNGSVSGTNNTAFGSRSQLSTTSGAQNSSFGRDSVLSCSTASANSGFGWQSLFSCNADFNSAFGGNAGSGITSGSNNLVLGYNAGTDAVATLSTQSNYVVVGNDSTTNANIKVAWTVTSDARDKTNFTSIPYGLDFVNKLKPTAYQFKKDRNSKEVAEDSRIRYGFLAQDILALEGNDSVIIDNRDEDNLKYNESSLIPVLVKAIQELSEQFNAYKASHP